MPLVPVVPSAQALVREDDVLVRSASAPHNHQSIVDTEDEGLIPRSTQSHLKAICGQQHVVSPSHMIHTRYITQTRIFPS
jgi:hypothetical protein